jgi:hypothetical protein
MKIEAHLEKFKRFDRLLSQLDAEADFELWYWAILNAGTAIINAALHSTGVTREESSFATQIANIYSVPAPNGTRQLEYRFDVDLIHVGMPKIDSPLPPPLITAFAEMRTIEEFRDPCIREDRPVTPEVIRTCSSAYAKCTAAAKSVIAHAT